VGVGAFASGIFHLMTHAFFKALLFLGAGSVIHALSGEQDLWKMGGLKAHLPKTHNHGPRRDPGDRGVFPFAGFFSKDEIPPGMAPGPGGPWLWMAGNHRGVPDAFYMSGSTS